ncbi:hypothetical protein MHBO_000493 [Bonamia ostreae]|uniref:Maturase K n=1 Tax=Bonamia ostreae TaxID=126728 RepID=A0ABV2AFV4_9EUKA
MSENPNKSNVNGKNMDKIWSTEISFINKLHPFELKFLHFVDKSLKKKLTDDFCSNFEKFVSNMPETASSCFADDICLLLMEKIDISDETNENDKILNLISILSKRFRICRSLNELFILYPLATYKNLNLSQKLLKTIFRSLNIRNPLKYWDLTSLRKPCF